MPSGAPGYRRRSRGRSCSSFPRRPRSCRARRSTSTAAPRCRPNWRRSHDTACRSWRRSHDTACRSWRRSHDGGGDAAGAGGVMNTTLLQQVRDSLPKRLNAGILMGDGGFCILGWMLLSAGYHPITLYSNTIGVVDPATGGPAIDVVARVYGLDRTDVVRLARLNDTTPRAARRDAVREALDGLLAGASA